MDVCLADSLHLIDSPIQLSPGRRIASTSHCNPRKSSLGPKLQLVLSEQVRYQESGLAGFHFEYPYAGRRRKLKAYES